MRYLALDPGKTTGWATYAYARSTKYEPDEKGLHLSQWARGQLSDGNLELWQFIDDYQPDVLIYERFLYQRRDKVDLTPVERIGVIKFYAESYDTDELFEQTPAQAKNLWTDDKLKKLDLWLPGQRHAMDATRHMLYHLVVTKGDRSWLNQLR